MDRPTDGPTKQGVESRSTQLKSEIKPRGLLGIARGCLGMLGVDWGCFGCLRNDSESGLLLLFAMSLVMSFVCILVLLLL